MNKLLVIQIPCFNEEKTLPLTVNELPKEVEGFERVEVVVIDDGSTDGTVEKAKSLGIQHIIEHGYNRGLAKAYVSGLEYSLALGADVIVNTDADNQYDAGCIAALVAPITCNSADLVVGARPIVSIEHFSRLKKFLQRFGSWVVRFASGTDVEDAASGFRAISRAGAQIIEVHSRYSYTMETLIQAGREGMRVISVPVSVNAQTRESRLVKSVPRYVLRSASSILRSFITYMPLRFFSLLSIPFNAIGLALLLRWIFHFFENGGRNSMVPSLLVSILFLVYGFGLIFLGLIGNLISTNRRLISSLKRAAMAGDQHS